MIEIEWDRVLEELEYFSALLQKEISKLYHELEDLEDLD